MHSLLIDFLIFTAASFIFVPVFRYFKMGAILAYLFAGLVIGPHVLGFIKDPGIILSFSELGVVFLLFIIGLELAPQKLWELRKAIFGLGLFQVVLTGLLFFFIGKLLGLSNALSFVAGFGLSLSSTAFSIQMLEENRQLNTHHGQGAFAVLMFQDLAVIPLLALTTILSESNTTITPTLLDVVKATTIFAALIFIGRVIIRPLFRFIAESRTQEVFTAVSLFIVIGSALLIETAGLTMGMGAFFAGVLLANSEYRHELETNLQPFKGLLLGLFFMAVGMSLNIAILLKNPHWVILITLGFMTLKSAIIYFLSRGFKYPSETAKNMAAILPQGGEFAFVLFSLATQKQIMSYEESSILNASVTISMALTPLAFALNQKWFRKSSEITERPYDVKVIPETEVIIAGYGRFGQIVSRFLSAEEIKHTILEHSAAQVETARKFGNKVFYGDASRADILEAAGAKKAKIFVLAIDDPEKSLATAKLLKEHFPNLTIIARARNRRHAIDLMELGIDLIHRETYLTSLEVAKEVLLLKGEKREIINKRLAKFRTHDEEILKKQFELRHDEHQFVSFTAQANKELEEILIADKKNTL